METKEIKDIRVIRERREQREARTGTVCQEGNGYARKGMAMRERDKKGGSFLCPKKVL